MSVLSSVFGLRLRSNLQIPGLLPVNISAECPDVEVHLGASPVMRGELPREREELRYVSPYCDDSGNPALRIWNLADGALLRLDYFDGTQFWLESTGKTVWAQWPANLTIEDAATYLLGPVFGLVLRLRGVTCLHASAVAFDNYAVAFAGCEGAGKSTTAAALARRGHSVISDDIVALMERDGAFFVPPAYPYLSLWLDSVNLLYGPDKVLPCFSPNWDKRQLSLAENRLQFQGQPLPLRAIFLLGERSTDATAPFVEMLAPREGLLSLIANSYATNALDRDMRACEFELLGRILAAVPVWRLRPHKDGSRIDRLCDLIQERCNNSQVLCSCGPETNDSGYWSTE